MSSILVVEPETHSSARLHGALGADGWRVRIVGEAEQARQAAAAERPDLLLVSAAVPGAAELAAAFSRGAGGPGVVALLPAGAGGGNGLAADELLVQPFTDQELRQAVQRALARPAAPRGGVMLTSQDIFGDVLAEVEADIPPPQKPQTPQKTPPPRPAPATPPPAATAAPAPSAPPAPRSAGSLDDDEISRKLEKTLSGVLGPEPRPRPAVLPAAAAPPAPRKPEVSPFAGDDVDALLNRTLSTLELGPRNRSSAPRPPAPPAGARPDKSAGAIDISSLEALARPGRRREPAPALPAPPPAPRGDAARAAMEAEAEPFAEAAIEALPEPPEIPEWPPVPTAAAPDPGATQRIQIPPLEEPAGDPPGTERFGQYTLLEKIAAGGMAEVWKARMRGVEGFQKTVAIKKILPHMTESSEFVTMFVDEAKLAAQLGHPNIVHIYDLGKIGRTYYIAMEYVEGKDLRSLLNAARRKGLRLPPELALLIGARLASALDYAHRKRDFEDREMGLVHRDVSPQNVLLSREGDVKLCDFGIAKAVSNAGQTQMGALKGKLLYMSPEQAWGRPVDARSDIFSLGAVLFEMLTGEKLFAGETELSVLEAVRQGQIRSTRQAAPSIPPEVDEIVARALAYEPQSRFASAGEMKQRIEATLHALGLSPDPTDLAAWIQRVLDEEEGSGDWSQPVPATASGVAQEERHGAVADAPAPRLGVSGASGTAGVAPAEVLPSEGFADANPLEPAEEAQAVQAVAPLGEVQVEESAPRGRGLLYAVIAALILAGILTVLFLFLRRPATEGAEPAPRPAASQAPPVTSPAPPPAAAATPVPAASPAPAAATTVDLEKIVSEELAKQEEEIRRKLDARERQLREELSRVQAENRKRQKAAQEAAAEGEPGDAPSPPP